MIDVRNALPQDMPFIRASWFESYRKAKPKLPFEVYRSGMDSRITRLLARSVTNVAFVEAVPSEIVGYSVREGDFVHWVYVKNDYRKQGVAAALCEGVRCYTHECSKDGRLWALRLNLEFKPEFAEG